jgi:peptidyl-prolyl cis-trans isomerase A (cyclophilin A)
MRVRARSKRAVAPASKAWLALAVWGALSACQASAPEPRFLKEATPKPPGRAGEPVKTPPAQAAPVEVAPSAPPSPPTGAVGQGVPPDPIGGKFSLADATAGLAGKGKLRASIDTGYGKLECALYEDKTPNTVANFVGLARGLRPFWDAKARAWVKRPLFDGTSFHRTIADFMIQGGDHIGDGTGQVGYVIADELVGLKHDRAGLLCMANRGPNTNGGQFFITDAAAPHLTQMNTYTIFGECTPESVIHRIARAPRADPHSERPDPVVPIRKVAITRR